jgi:tRNA-dihydrouridine synthase
MQKLQFRIMENISNSFSIHSKLILAPMVRIGTLPFRLLSLRHGADYVFTEEIIAKKLRFCEKFINNDLKCNDYISKKDGSLVLRVHPEEKGKLVLQIGASDPDDALEASLICKEDIIGVDVNMGCPKHFSTHGNMGSALLLLPNLAKQILEKLVQESGLPVSCKIRLLHDMEKTEEFINTIQSTGIKFFTIHLRIKDQQPKFKANWKALLEVKKWAKIPFNANGDILSPHDIYLLNKHQLCDGFMMARGAIHNPNIFNEYKNQTLTYTDYLEYGNDDEDEKQFLNNNDYEIDSSNLVLNPKEIIETKDKELNKDLNCNHSRKNKKNQNEASFCAEDEMKVSNNLAKVFDKKYNKKYIDIMPIVKEYVQIALQVGNNFNNSKYSILYILKTHKKHMDIFKKIQSSRNFEELSKLLNMEEVYEKYLNCCENMKKYYDNSFYKENKAKITLISKQQGKRISKNDSEEVVENNDI